MNTGLSIFAVVIAIVLPLGIERLKRPTFRIWAANSTAVGDIKYLHVAVANEPMGKFTGRLLLRNTATGCRASVSFEEPPIGSGKRPVQHEPARWSARPVPMTSFVGVGGSPTLEFDPSKLEQCFRMDVSPGENGEVVIVAFKHAGDRPAYALSRASYEEGIEDGLRSAKLELPGDEYKLTVRVEAGGVNDYADFRVRNRGETHDGFSIEPWAA